MILKKSLENSFINDSILQYMTIDENESRKWMDQLREIKTEEEMILMRKPFPSHAMPKMN